MIKLSYLISTRNRLRYLKINLERLIANILPDEEIVVVDANSTDGSTLYLQALLKAGKIHQFISEPDKNQAHGWNKAMLMAKGTLLKKIIDDDVFDYNEIRKCASYMIENPGVDVVISSDLSSGIYNYKDISLNSSRLKHYKEWKAGKINCFSFSDVHMLVRKSILSYIGLYNTSFVMIDWEYSLRMSFLNINISYYTGYNALNVGTPNNVSSTVSKKILQNEARIGQALYGYPGDNKSISFWSKIKIAIGKRIYAKPVNPNTYPEINLNEIYDRFYEHINKINSESNGQFINK
jgi:glycosyltransferase involved in cell wall biosynthesis